MAAKPKQLFEYLLAIKNMTTPPVRDIRDYDWTIFAHDDLPIGDGCFLYGTGQDDDSWLEVHRQTLKSAPKPSRRFADWLTTDFTDPMRAPEVKTTRVKAGMDALLATDDDVERFTDNEGRVESYELWQKEWSVWAAQTRPKKAVQDLYQYLFSLLQRLEREGELLELAFGHGLLTWDHPEAGRICRPLFVTRLDLAFDSRRGVFTLQPTQRGSVMETEMLSGIEVPNASRFSRIREESANLECEMYDSLAMEPLYTEIVQTLHPEGMYAKNRFDLQFASFPIITDKPVLFLRRRSGQLWKEELQGIIDAIDLGVEVPKTVQSLFQMEPVLPSGTEQEAWDAVGEQLLFPLPANEDQRDIARRLATNFGVVVQGPPGTGKSHTIANLVSHLLAHGKRVLVTSHTERALRVLADKIPAEIRALCVPVLGGDLRSLQEIEDSVDALSDGMSTYDEHVLAGEISAIESSLNTVRTRRMRVNALLRDVAVGEHEVKTVDTVEMTPLLAAKWIAEHEEWNWLPDAVAIDTEFPLTDDEFRTFWQQKSSITHEDLTGLTAELPNLERLQTPAQFEQWLHDGQVIAETVALNQEHLTHFSIQFTREELMSVQHLLTTVLKERAVLESEYLSAILNDMTAKGEREQTWTELEQYVTSQLTEIGTLRRELAEYAIVLPSGDFADLVQDVSLLAEKLREGKAGKMFFITSGRKLRYLIEEPIVDGHPIRTETDARVVLGRLRLTQTEDKLARKWNTTLAYVQGPAIETSELRWTAVLEEHLVDIRRAIALADILRTLRTHVTDSALPLSFRWTDPHALLLLGKALEAYEWTCKDEDWCKEAEETRAFLLSHIDPAQRISHYRAFLAALDERDIAKWKTAYETVEHLWSVRDKAEDWKRMFRAFESVLPMWAQDIVQGLGRQEPFPEDWKQALLWAKLNAWIHSMEQTQPELLERQLEELADEERRLVTQLVAKSTWRSQLLRITEPQKRALQAWKQKIKRIGKGTGKYASKYRREARAEMEVSQGAIPVWIMPVHRVIENFSVSGDPFDVVIVDESSQCDIHALSVLMRAQKAVIVGDDEQISPAAVGVDQSAVHALVEQYLTGIPQANSLDVQTSLYDIAVRVFPGKLMLKEHFRCVPEIIQFSNDLSYGGQIVPLRIPTESERVRPAVLAKFVPGYRLDGNRAVNLIEAEAIAADIKMMVQDPAFKGQTIGVISLQQEDQARLIENLLREEIGEEEIYHRRIICGDAYAFQGDERDIIFMSMVVANNVRYAPLTKRDAQQRFNVAASRARNHMRLYHSVALGELNPNDMRYRLLQYCQSPMRVFEEYEDLENLCESQFERDVLRRILAEGYRVRPQVRVGRYRIDLVVEGLSDRLAVECDGDAWHGILQWEEDRARQRVLERAGWKFWRVRGSAFYRDPKQTMKPLWALLREMRIEQALHEAQTAPH